MASKTASEIKTTLEAQTYPYPLRFYTTRQKFPIYPYVEIKVWLMFHKTRFHEIEFQMPTKKD